MTSVVDDCPGCRGDSEHHTCILAPERKEPSGLYSVISGSFEIGESVISFVQDAAEVKDRGPSIDELSVNAKNERTFYETLDDLRSDCSNPQDIVWRDKMLHKVPDAPVVDRVHFILSKCEGKRVLNIGSASGGLHDGIRKVAKEVWGVDKDETSDADMVLDLDSFRGLDDLIVPEETELIVCGEVLEHLANPGNFLRVVREQIRDIPVLITAPNAFSASRQYAAEGIECVNRDHVSWYSYRTLRTLVERCGFEVLEFAWYNGRPMFAEGVVFVVR
jgi:2-polyprenyl-3-methyl-5-hydroxy-6-metoxy-1,4-benzoquinol methylase